MPLRADMLLMLRLRCRYIRADAVMLQLRYMLRRYGASALLICASLLPFFVTRHATPCAAFFAIIAAITRLR